MPAELLIPGMILGGFALISSTGLLIASKKFHVDEDPRIEKINSLLPGALPGYRFFLTPGEQYCFLSRRPGHLSHLVLCWWG